MKIITKSEKGTIMQGKKFAARLKGGEVILLVGDLGAGKTTFVKGVAVGFDLRKNITSPTFVIMKIYKISKHLKIKNLIHIDTYRGLDINDLENIGALEYFGRDDCVCFVEWGAGLEDYLRKGKIRMKKIKFNDLDENTREIIIT